MTTTSRGYGWSHQQQRARWAPLVAAGTVTCWRCGAPIAPGEAWDLGHDDHDRRLHRGPEHAAKCNRAAAGRRRAEQAKAQRYRPSERHPGFIG